MKYNVVGASILIAIVLSSAAFGGQDLEEYVDEWRWYTKSIADLDPKLQAKIQERLLEEGYDPGTIDGKFGPRSSAALAGC